MLFDHDPDDLDWYDPDGAEADVNEMARQLVAAGELPQSIKMANDMAIAELLRPRQFILLEMLAAEKR